MESGLPLWQREILEVGDTLVKEGSESALREMMCDAGITVPENLE